MNEFETYRRTLSEGQILDTAGKLGAKAHELSHSAFLSNDEHAHLDAADAAKRAAEHSHAASRAWGISDAQKKMHQLHHDFFGKLHDIHNEAAHKIDR